jgi:hypothetical protein
LSLRLVEDWMLAEHDVRHNSVETLISSDHRVAMEEALTGLQCDDWEAAIRRLCVAIQTVARRTPDINAGEALRVVREMRDSARRLAQVLEADMWNDWFELEHHMARTVECDEDEDTKETAVDLVSETRGALPHIAEAAETLLKEIESDRSEWRQLKSPGHHVIARTVIDMHLRGDLQTRSPLSHTGPLADLCGTAFEAAGLERPSNIVSYLRQALRMLAP